MSILPEAVDLAIVAELACELVGAQRASLLLPAAGSRALVFAAAHGIDAEIIADAHAWREDGIARLVADTRQPLLVNGDRPGLPLNRAARYKSVSFISVPVSAGQDGYGVLSVADPARSPRFVADHLRLLTGLGSLVTRSLAAAAVAQQRDELERSAAELQRQVVETQESERSRIARDLHDEVGQTLTTAVLRLDLAARQLPPDSDPVVAALRQTRSALLDMANTLHGIVFMLHPRILSDLGLIPALRSFFAQVEDSSGLKTHLNIAGVERTLDPAIELTVFRIVQEGITNTVKHAGPSQARVTLTFHPESLEVRIEDNGVGIGAEALSPRQRPMLGLRGMRERIETLGGTLSIDSREGHGTALTAALPIDGGGEW